MSKIAMKIELEWLKRIALLEGVSLICLMFVAMPIKYWLGMGFDDVTAPRRHRCANVGLQ